MSQASALRREKKDELIKASAEFKKEEVAQKAQLRLDKKEHIRTVRRLKRDARMIKQKTKLDIQEIKAKAKKTRIESELENRHINYLEENGGNSPTSGGLRDESFWSFLSRCFKLKRDALVNKLMAKKDRKEYAAEQRKKIMEDQYERIKQKKMESPLEDDYPDFDDELEGQGFPFIGGISLLLTLGTFAGFALWYSRNDQEQSTGLNKISELLETALGIFDLTGGNGDRVKSAIFGFGSIIAAAFLFLLLGFAIYFFWRQILYFLTHIKEDRKHIRNFATMFKYFFFGTAMSVIRLILFIPSFLTSVITLLLDGDFDFAETIKNFRKGILGKKEDDCDE